MFRIRIEGGRIRQRSERCLRRSDATSLTESEGVDDPRRREALGGHGVEASQAPEREARYQGPAVRGAISHAAFFNAFPHPQNRYSAETMDLRQKPGTTYWYGNVEG